MINLRKSKWSCQQCQKKHNSLLNYELKKKTENKPKKQKNKVNSYEFDKRKPSATVLPVSLTVNRIKRHVAIGHGYDVGDR